MAYIKEVFDPVNLEHAKDIVLTPDPKNPDKFEEETAYLVRFLDEHELVNPETRVLDFGCGMGRVSKKLIDIFGCRVVGTDISPRMLDFARQYVNNPARFEAKHEHGAQDIDLALCSLVLQHVEHPEEEVRGIYSVLRPGGRVVLLDDGKRFVPADVDANRYVIWEDDGVKITDSMSRYFTHLGSFPYCARTDTPLSLWQKAD